MSFVRLIAATRAKPAAVKVRLEIVTGRSGMLRPKLVVLIGEEIVKEIGWALGKTYECLWGEDEDAGKIMLTPDPKGYSAQKSGKVANGAISIPVYTVSPKLELVKQLPATCPHELRDVGLIVVLPAEWWATAKESLAVRMPKPVPNYAGNYADPMQKAGAQEVLGPATPPTPSTPSAIAGQQASDPMPEPEEAENGQTVAGASNCWVLEKQSVSAGYKLSPSGRFWTGRFTKGKMPVTTPYVGEAKAFASKADANVSREALLKLGHHEMGTYRPTEVKQGKALRSAA